MLIITDRIKEGNIVQEKQYNIYQNYNEVMLAQDKYGFEICTKLIDVKPYQYVQTDNGYYIPVLEVEPYHLKRDTYYKVRLVLPLRNNVLVFDKTSKKMLNNFIVYYDKPTVRAVNHISARQVYWVKLMKQGIDFITAFSVAFNCKTKQLALYQILQQLSSMELINYMIEQGIHQSLASEFRRVGLNGTYVAEKLMNIIEANGKDTKWALETAINVLDRKESAFVQQQTINYIESNFDDEMAQRMLDKTQNKRLEIKEVPMLSD